jgi:hypothetical protein
MNPELISRLEELLQKDPAESAADVRILQKEYQRERAAREENARLEFINDGGRSGDFAYAPQPEEHRFEELLKDYERARKESEKQLAAAQARNLTARQDIIAKVRDLSKVSENVGSAVRKLQELQQEWKQAGPVSPHKYKEVQSEYSRALEDIYYNLKIFRDLQEHDLKKNFEMKTELIGKLRALRDNENIKEAEHLIKVYRNEWDETGPVPHAKWDALKQEYKAALEENYTRIKAYYNSLEEQKGKNLEHKQQIIERLKELLGQMQNAKPAKWNEASAAVIAMQGEWKTAGRAPDKQNDRVWAEFRALCDEFFDKKKAFFTSLNEKIDVSRKARQELIAKAEAFAGSTDWQKTGHDLMKLQEDWKKLPGYGDKDEHKLFLRFRKACNAFFEAKKGHQDKLDAGFHDNLVKKESLVEKVNALVLPDDITEARSLLKQLGEEWAQAGPVPAKDKKRVNDAFFQKLDEHYDKLHLDKDEKMLIQFSNRLQKLLASDNPFENLMRESDQLKKQIDETEVRVRKFENNLGFFKSSKGDNPIMKEIEEKIGAEREKVMFFGKKKKMLSEELRRLKENQTVPESAKAH